MGIHIQTGSISPQTIKPISEVTALIVSAGVNNTITPVLKIMNEISGPSNIFQVFSNGIVKLNGTLPRMVLGTSSSNPSDEDNVEDGALMVQTNSHNVFFKSGSIYRKINSEESISFSTTTSVSANSTIDLANFTVPLNKKLFIRSIGSLLYDSTITVKVLNTTDSLEIASSSNPTSIVNTTIDSEKNVKFQVINNSGSTKNAAVVVKYDFI